MTVRDEVLIALVEEVLGPRNGPKELLPDDQDPRDEYITGVLAPSGSRVSSHDIDSDVDEVVEEASGEEDELDSTPIGLPPLLSPALNPKELPSSLGVSFVVESVDSGATGIGVCVTWARYNKEEHGWRRHPYHFHHEFQIENSCDVDTAQGTRLAFRSRPGENNLVHVSVYLVNSSPVVRDVRPSTESHIFQPQIRVKCGNALRVVPVHVYGDNDGSSVESDELLYRNKNALARGHLCAAMWSSIDPERPHPIKESPRSAPFYWEDGQFVDDEIRAEFTVSDIRTEYVPCYPVESPELGWSEEYGPSPLLDAAELAETWDPCQLRNALEPLTTAYETWLKGQKTISDGLPPRLKSIADGHLKVANKTLQRIVAAISLVCSNEDVRLAFCFANKALDTQSRWRGEGNSLRWRPFQLGFFLLTLPGIVDPLSDDRNECDLLWIPTGGGKTEAYLGIIAFTLAFRRLVVEASHSDGVGVISRYTLRLLTIQQFRRALGVITACETLRVSELGSGHPVGWRPQGYHVDTSFLWGGTRFSTGLWVGGNVTPNSLHGVTVPVNGRMTRYMGALDALEGLASDYIGDNPRVLRILRTRLDLEPNGEPAQVLNCPCCDTVLAVSDKGFSSGNHRLFFPLSEEIGDDDELTRVAFPSQASTIRTANHNGRATLIVDFQVAHGEVLGSKQIDDWWYTDVRPVMGANRLLSARPSRPGYLVVEYRNSQGSSKPSDFQIYCPNPNCYLNNQLWAEQVPLSVTSEGLVANEEIVSNGILDSQGRIKLPNVSGLQWQDVPEWCKSEDRWTANSIPIPAYTVDDQIYHRCPSLVVGTVDKFARLSFEPKAGGLFGNVDHYHSRWGYYRAGSPPSGDSSLPTRFSPHPPGFNSARRLHVTVPPFLPPDLIIQDELHLIEGPLGSMVGLYETVVEALCERNYQDVRVGPKYIAATATVREAEPQVRALFNRSLAQFPPPIIDAGKRFFATEMDTHPLDSESAGRLYVGIAAPGRGAQTPLIRIWSALLQAPEALRSSYPRADLDGYSTLVGYFNAVRELAGGTSLYRQDIPERMQFRYGDTARDIDDSRRVELSSRTSSLELPTLLDELNLPHPFAPEAVFSTSMFGTGVDVPRLAVMVVHGQPKTTASYIQATGRVGRKKAGLVIDFLRASRPRDLDHYEFFTGYHMAFYRHVEPVTVAPFSPGARERGLGPLAVALLRQSRFIGNTAVAADWAVQQRLSGSFHSMAQRMGSRRHDMEVRQIPQLMEIRAQIQPDGRRPPAGVVRQETESELDVWASIALRHPSVDEFVYYEPSLVNTPSRHVVLGDPQHSAQGLAQAYRNSPQSLRDVEETTTFQG